MNQLIAFPPPPKLGSYPEDVAWCKRMGVALPKATVNVGSMSHARHAAPVHESTQISDDSLAEEDWDSTVLSSINNPADSKRAVVLRNTANGQEIVLKRNTLLGRKPSADVPEGTDAVALVDSTRTVSRNHASVEFHDDGTVWIKDLGSLNGTFIIDGEDETPVGKLKEAQIEPGITVRIGDEFYEVGEPEK